MSDGPAERFVSADVTLGGKDWQLKTRVTVPAGPMPLRQALPMVQALTDRVADGAVQAVEAEGARLS